MTRSVIVTGSVIGIERGVYDGDAGIDPAVLKGAIGITWDALELCLSYGLDAEQIKGILTAAPALDRADEHGEGDALRGDDSRCEGRVGNAIGGHGGHLPVVGNVVVQHGLEYVVDKARDAIVALRSLLNFRHRRTVAKPVHESREPRPLPSECGVLAKDGNGHFVERIGPAGMFDDHWFPHVKSRNEARHAASRESGASA